MDNKKEIKDETKTYISEGMSIGMCIETSLGVVVGVFTDNIPKRKNGSWRKIQSS